MIPINHPDFEYNTLCIYNIYNCFANIVYY